jgi:hypothetical protein
VNSNGLVLCLHLLLQALLKLAQSGKGRIGIDRGGWFLGRRTCRKGLLAGMAGRTGIAAAAVTLRARPLVALMLLWPPALLLAAAR